MKHKLAPSKKEVLINKLSSHLSGYKQISSAYIFGSFIQPDVFSDIDIGILANGKIEPALDFELKLEIELEDLIRYPVDVRILNNAPLSFSHNVIRHGMIIIDRDQNFRADFTGYILKQYFDFAPYRKRYLMEVMHAPI